MWTEWFLGRFPFPGVWGPTTTITHNDYLRAPGFFSQKFLREKDFACKVGAGFKISLR